MKWLNNMKIRNKLLLLLLLPCLSLTFFLIKSLNDNYHELWSVTYENQLQELASSVHQISNSIGKEGELSILSVLEGDTIRSESNLSRELAMIREEVDRESHDLQMAFKNSSLNLSGRNVNIYLQELSEKFSDLENIRADIDGKAISQDQVLQFYSKIEDELIHFITEIANNSLHLANTKNLIAYLFLSEEEKYKWMQKDLLLAFIKMDQLSPENYEKIIESHVSQTVSRNAFFEVAQDDAKQRYRELIGGVKSKNFPTLRKYVNLEEKLPVQEKDYIKNEWIKSINDHLNKLEVVAAFIMEKNTLLIDKMYSRGILIVVLESILVSFLVIMTTALTYAIVKSISRPLLETTTSAEKISEGNLSELKEVALRKDEIGIMQNALHKMVKGLREITNDHLREIDHLNNSTNNIVSSISKVTSGTAETATAVTETTTTVEELKQTAMVSADKSKDVQKRAEVALETLNDSEKSIADTVLDMNQIQERMTTISESIVKLSEHTQVIGMIIDSVNDLAEQSNLLAVNAAIEAAKAGDQGKGFSVVAQEVRSLAEQSKQATVQVHTILNDIQNATSSAVMATEQGAKAVSKGVQQSSQTVESIRSLSVNVSSVEEAAAQISASSQQQLVGVDQVNIAMTNIREASNQHVSHMEEIETSVNDLNGVSQSLKQLIDKYQL